MLVNYDEVKEVTAPPNEWRNGREMLTVVVER